MTQSMPVLSGRAMWLGGVTLAASNFMVVLDATVANVSVPHIAGSLAIAPDQGTWVITSYSVAEAICVPLTGWLTERFGAVRLFMICMAGFAFMSLLCGFSVSLGMLVACRVGQGFCGGPLMPLTQTLLVRVFPPEKRGQAMGMWAMTTVTAPIAGPLLGGAISDDWSWHWIFFINLPAAALCMFATYTLLRRVETPTSRQARIDMIGLVALVVWVGALQIMLDIGRDHDWFGSTEIWVLAITAAIGFVFFVIWELTEKNPVVDLRVFRHRGFTCAVAALGLTFGTYFASVVVTPQWLQGALGYTATWAGRTVAWSGLFAVIMSPIVGRLLGRGWDPRLLVSLGTLWVAFTVSRRIFWSSDVDYWSLAIPHLLIGLGTPFFLVPITLLALSSVEPRETASAAGLSSFIRTLASAICASVATTIWTDRAAINRADLVGISTPPPAFADMLAQHGVGAGLARGLFSNILDGQAVALATVQLYTLATAVLVFSAFLVWLAPKPRRTAPPGAAH